MQTISVEEAVAKIEDGTSLLIGGFMAVGTPERMIDEIVHQGNAASRLARASAIEMVG